MADISTNAITVADIDALRAKVTEKLAKVSSNYVAVKYYARDTLGLATIELPQLEDAYGLARVQNELARVMTERTFLRDATAIAARVAQLDAAAARLAQIQALF